MFKAARQPGAARLGCTPGWTEAVCYRQSMLWTVLQVPSLRAAFVFDCKGAADRRDGVETPCDFYQACRAIPSGRQEKLSSR